MVKRNWRDLSDDELKSEARSIARSCDSSTEVSAKLKSDFDYPYSVAVTYSKPNGAGQRMMMGMMHGKNGNTISF